MNEIILALLVAKFQGTRNDVLKQLARVMALQAANEEEAKAAVDKLTDAQVSEFSKDFRADVDKEVSESTKTFEANLKKKFDLVAKKVDEPGGNQDKNNPNDIAAAIKAAVAEAVAPLNEKLAGYEAGNVAKSRLDALNAKLNDCKDETFKSQTLKDFARMTFATDEEFNQYLTEKTTDIATANQNVANAALAQAGGSPLFTQKDESGISKGVADFVASQKPETATFSGKEL